LAELLKIFKLEDISYLEYAKFFDICVSTEYLIDDLVYVFSLEDFLITLVKTGKFEDILSVDDFYFNHLQY